MSWPPWCRITWVARPWLSVSNVIWASSIETGGGTLGVVLDFNPPFAGQTIAIGAANHIANYVYCCKNPVTYPTGDPVPPSEFSPLTFADDTFGNPPLNNVIVVAGLSSGDGSGRA